MIREYCNCVLEQLEDEKMNNEEKSRLPVPHQQLFNELISARAELQAYHAIGTLEECGEARKKQKAMKIEVKYLRNINGDVSDTYYCCPNCGEYIELEDCEYCPNCGQAFDWSDSL